MAAAAILFNDFYFLFWLFWERAVVFYKIPNFDAFWTIGAKITLKNWFCHFGWDFPINPPKIEVFGGPRPQKWKLVNGTPKRHFLAREHVVWAINHQHRFSGSGCSPVKEIGKKKKSTWNGGRVAPASVNRSEPFLAEGVRSRPRCPMSVWVFLGSSVWELCGGQILGFAFTTYMAYNNMHCTSLHAVITVFNMQYIS